MKTQEELRAEFQRLFDADMLDEAEAILDKLEPLSDEEWQKFLEAAPIDDEPLSQKELEALARADERRASQLAKNAG